MINLKDQIETITREISAVYFTGIGQDREMYYHASYKGRMLTMVIDDYGKRKLILTDQLAQVLGFKDVERLLLADMRLKYEYKVGKELKGI